MTTVYGWDASHWDWDRGSMDLRAAARDGISFCTHKVCEGAHFFQDPRYPAFAGRAHGVVPVVGGYAVNHPGDQRPQVDWFISLLDAHSPWWRDEPFLVQLDAEKFSYMTRAPSPAECQQWCDYFVARTGGTHRPIVYGPRWLYGDTLAQLSFPLWASDYAGNPATHYTQAYPGDTSGRWSAYSGQVPTILQYGSRLTIGSQTGCDADAFRGSVADLVRLVGPGHSQPTPAPTPAPTPTPTPSPSPTPTPAPSDWTEVLIMALPTLQRGSTGQYVRNLQALLGANGSGTAVDGIFGPDTQAKVRAFQTARKLAVDGVVGRHTWSMLVAEHDS